MKKIILLLLITAVSKNVFCKDIRDKKYIKYALSQMNVEVNGFFGPLTQNLATGGKMGTYLQPAIYHAGNLKFTDGKSIGGTAQFSYFFGLKKHFGIGGGLMYAAQQGNMSLDSFHVEYKETDRNANDFRQLITTKSLKESQQITNISIPIVGKYQLAISKRLTLSVDAGIVINLVESIKYKADASTNFEAIYKFNQSGATEYDGAANPSLSDWYITEDMYSMSHSANTANLYFDTLRQRGFNVALGVHPSSKSGSVTYNAGSIGFIIRPAIAFNITEHTSVTLGGFYMSQTIKNTPKDSYRTMDINGNYSSPLHAVTSIVSTSYGVNLGVKYSFGW